MKIAFVLAAALAAIVQTAAAQETFTVFKGTLSLPVSRVITVNGVQKFETKTLTGNDLVNIVLNRKLGSKVDAKTEVLALAAAYDEGVNNGTPGGDSTPHSKVIIYNSVTKEVVATICRMSFAYFQDAYYASGIKGNGFGNGDWVESSPSGTVLGKLFASEFSAAGTGTQKSGSFSGGVQGLSSGTGSVKSIAGKLKFTFTTSKGATSDFEGFVLKGALSCSGKALGTFNE